MSNIHNSMLRGFNNIVAIDGEFCPICEEPIVIYMNIYEHPNSMFSIKSCAHVNIAGCSNETNTEEEWKIIKQEILDFKDS